MGGLDNLTLSIFCHSYAGELCIIQSIDTFDLRLQLVIGFAFNISHDRPSLGFDFYRLLL
jgi:hypothetical protein